jgi:DNA-binding MarR family transcriptional regulator
VLFRSDLDTGTLSPLLKRMEALGIISRCRNKDDERSVEIQLTESGQRLEDKAHDIPTKMLSITGFTPEQLQLLNPQLDQLLVNISDSNVGDS